MHHLLKGMAAWAETWRQVWEGKKFLRTKFSNELLLEKSSILTPKISYDLFLSYRLYFACLLLVSTVSNLILLITHMILI